MSRPGDVGTNILATPGCAMSGKGVWTHGWEYYNCMLIIIIRFKARTGDLICNAITAFPSVLDKC